MGSKTYELCLSFSDWPYPGKKAFVFTQRTLKSDRDDVVFVSSDPDGERHWVFYTHSSDGGVSWSNANPVVSLISPEPAYLSTRIRVDSAGRLHVTYEGRSIRYGRFSEVGYARSVNGGGSWSPKRVLAKSVSSPGVARPAAFVFGEDEIHLTWDSPERMHQWSKDGGTTWSEPTPIVIYGAAFGGFNQLAKDSSGLLHAVVAAKGMVSHVVWDGSAWGPLESIDARDLDFHNQQLVACQGNQLHVVYDEHGGDEEVMYSTRKADGPHIPRESIPHSQWQAPASEPEMRIESTATSSRQVQTTQATQVTTDSRRETPAPIPSPLSPLLTATGLVAVLLAIVTVVEVKRKRS